MLVCYNWSCVHNVETTHVVKEYFLKNNGTIDYQCSVCIQVKSIPSKSCVLLWVWSWYGRQLPYLLKWSACLMKEMGWEKIPRKISVDSLCQNAIVGVACTMGRQLML